MAINQEKVKQKMAERAEKEKEAETTVVMQETMEEVVAPTRVLRSHAVSYEAKKKAGHEAFLSVCFAKTSTRAMLSAKQLKDEIGYDAKKDWLDIRYDDEGQAILIGKSEGSCGVKPIVKEKKLIIYSSLIVKDIVNTLGLDFTDHSSVSAYSFKKEKLAGKDYIVVENKDFV